MESKERNPDWTRDELILALDLYIRFKGNPPGKTSQEDLMLSQLLNRLGSEFGKPGSKYRNANGVYMKCMNFRRFDPAYKNSGKVGLQRGNKLEEEVWRTFADKPELLREVASAISDHVLNDDSNLAPVDDDEETVEADEGRLLTRVHRHRERSKKIVNKKKDAILKKTGRLACEACDFDFQAAYGARGSGFIEAHHTKPVHTLRPGDKTKLEDLALLCANCHRMVHVRQPWLTVETLRATIKAASEPAAKDTSKGDLAPSPQSAFT
ncbi:HNH endonuclease [Microvirga sp. CF3016]|uniref:HNH endonuclease n=1 Tax=Microvirga sp. CF3016 TaxID=3110181 RepID=UPI002E7A1527|nr:HNH endonuclease [Microvirga sp. CF3016]MEE1612726.1 HNH endonuclease [Microvirga sp. CF3016]